MNLKCMTKRNELKIKIDTKVHFLVWTCGFICIASAILLRNRLYAFETTSTSRKRRPKPGPLRVFSHAPRLSKGLQRNLHRSGILNRRRNSSLTFNCPKCQHRRPLPNSCQADKNAIIPRDGIPCRKFHPLGLFYFGPLYPVPNCHRCAARLCFLRCTSK